MIGTVKSTPTSDIHGRATSSTKRDGGEGENLHYFGQRCVRLYRIWNTNEMVAFSFGWSEYHHHTIHATTEPSKRPTTRAISAATAGYAWAEPSFNSRRMDGTSIATCEKTVMKL